MIKRAELEAVLAEAEIGWRRAMDELELARAHRDNANARWDSVVNERRKADADRRKSGAAWNQAALDRRNPDAVRRRADAGLVALSKEVADRDKAYTERSKAEADCADAQARLNTATAERKRAIAALDGLGHAGDVTSARSPGGIGQSSFHRTSRSSTG